MEEQAMAINAAEQKAYIMDKFQQQGDFLQLDGFELEAAVELAITTEMAYMDAIGDDGEYDDEQAYNQIHAAFSEKFEDFKMYAMRFVDDYLDYSEAYLESAGLIDWE